MPTSPGTKLGPYEILAPLGAGGMGEVYKARDTRLGREVALKILPPERLGDAQRRARFLHEARASSALTHPHIVTVHDVGEQDGVLYLAMELVDGETLERKLAAGPLAPSEALRLAAQAAGGLARAHETGLVHRDLKPANIMVTRSGEAKLLDFGLAKLIADAPSEDEATRTMAALTQEGAVMGTIAYMSPEQAQAKPVDARSDTFSFGSVLYEMLTGRRAFSGENAAATMAAILRDDPPPTTLPRPIDRIVRRCLRKDPARRYQSMADLQNALDEARDDLESGRSSVTTTAAVAEAPPSRLPWAWLGVLAGVALGAAGVWWGRPGPAAAQPMRIPQRLTDDGGSSSQPSLSADGKLMAFTSDRAGQGNLDIWVQQLPKGAARQVTFSAENETGPALSSDGTQIAYEVSGERGGIYIVPTLGGEEPRLVLANANRPIFTPDGKQLICRRDSLFRFRSELMAISVSGGEPRALAPGWLVSSARMSPDGRTIFAYGFAANQPAGPPNTAVPILVPVDGGPVSEVKAPAFFARHDQAILIPQNWARDSAGREWLYYNVYSGGDTMSLFRVSISSGGDLGDNPELILAGSESDQTQAVHRGGRLVFTSGTTTTRVWWAPLDVSTATIRGELTPVTGSNIRNSDVTISRDGVWSLFGKPGRMVLMKWPEQKVTVLGDEVGGGVLSPDGTRAAVDGIGPNQGTKSIIDLTGARRSRVVGKGLGQVRAFTPDGRWLLLNRTGGIHAVDVQSAEMKLILTDREVEAFAPSLNEDGRLIAFMARPRANPALTQLWTAPFRGNQPVPRAEWNLQVDTGNYEVNKPRLSPDGRWLFFVSNMGGREGVWALPLDATGKRAGPPKFVARAQRGELGDNNRGLAGSDLAIARDKLLVTLNERHANLWMIDGL